MMTLPGGWNDQRSGGTSPATAAPPPVEAATAISAQRCLAVTGGRALPTERRCAARTQLGMPALTLPTDEPPPSTFESVRPASVAAVSPPARRGPPPLPPHLAMPKVLVAPTPLLPDTVPAQRLQLQDDTCELDTADLLPLALQRRSAAPPIPATRARSRAAAAAPRGVRGLLATVLVRALALLAPSLQILPAPGSERPRAGCGAGRGNGPRRRSS